jgi:hypothetical protein
LTPAAKNIITESGSLTGEVKDSEKDSAENGNLPAKKGLSAIGGQITKNNFIVVIIALVAAILSAVIILILKRKLNKQV